MENEEKKFFSIEKGGLVYHERTSEGISRLIEVSKVLFSRKTKYQKIDVVETPELGKALFIDGKIQLSALDEHIYHECLIHPALFSHPNPKTILIVGGGDGAALEEVLKHKTVEKAILVDIDEEIIEIAKKYLSDINRNSFEDPRVKVVVMDGREFITQCKEKFDIIILDLVDPYKEVSRLYTKEFYQICREKLNENGILVTHSQSPYLLQKYFVTIHRTLASVFRFVKSYGAWIPSFGLYWMFTIASDFVDPTKIEEEEIKKRLKERDVETKYYHPKLHKALFILPKDVEDALEKLEVEISTDKNPLELKV